MNKWVTYCHCETLNVVKAKSIITRGKVPIIQRTSQLHGRISAPQRSLLPTLRSVSDRQVLTIRNTPWLGFDFLHKPTPWGVNHPQLGCTTSLNICRASYLTRSCLHIWRMGTITTRAI